MPYRCYPLSQLSDSCLLEWIRLRNKDSVPKGRYPLLLQNSPGEEYDWSYFGNVGHNESNLENNKVLPTTCTGGNCHFHGWRFLAWLLLVRRGVAESAFAAPLQLVRYRRRTTGNSIVAKLAHIIGAVYVCYRQCSYQLPLGVAGSAGVAVCQQVGSVWWQLCCQYMVHSTHLVGAPVVGCRQGY